MVFIPDYNVSVAELVIPGSDLSQHISSYLEQRSTKSLALREKNSTIKAPLQFARVARMVIEGYFGYKDYLKSLCDTVENGKDFYLVGSDFASYLEAQAAADKAYVDKEKWSKMSILCTVGSGRFSSDRTIKDYAEKTWGIQPCKLPF